MTSAISALDPAIREAAVALVEEARAAGLGPVVTSTRRTFAEQKRLYEKFLAGASRYPASPPGVGSHEYGWAFDLVVNDESALADLGDLWEQWGGTWGGNWNNPDAIHFELKGASALALRLGQLQAEERGFSIWDLLDGRFAVGRSKLWDWAQAQAGIR